MRVIRGTWRAWIALAIAPAAVLATCDPARAFYWPEWPGSRLRVQESPIIQPRTQVPVQPPPLVPIRDEPPPLGPPVPVDKPPVGPHPTPEPSTGLIGLLGLGALAAVRKWRGKK